VRASPLTLIVPLAVAAAVLMAPRGASAQPDFSRSTLTHEPAAVAEGDVVTFVAVARNSGTEVAEYAEVDIGLPLEAMFVDGQGLDGAEGGPLDKQFSLTVPLAAGGERRFSFRMVVPRDAGGHALVPTLRIAYPYRGVQFSTSDWIDVDTRAAGGGVSLGRWRVTSAEFALLAVLALYPALWFAIPQRRRSHGIVLPIVLAVGFWTLFAALAWRDWGTLTSWPEASCTVLDTRMREVTASSSIRPARSLPRSSIRELQPLLALRYDVDGTSVVSSGYETGTRLTIGRGARLVDEYARWHIGDTVRCWFNPDDPADVVVIRGFGGAYVFALFPLPVFVLGVLGLRGRRR
jgi:hypothetical protein